MCRAQLPDKRTTVAVRTAEVVPSELGGVPGVEIATMVLVVVVQSIVELPAQCQMTGFTTCSTVSIIKR